MYIGSTGEMGLHHLVYEVVDNSVDEALAGYAKRLTSPSTSTTPSPWSMTAAHSLDMMACPTERRCRCPGGADQAPCRRQVRRLHLQGLRRPAWRGVSCVNGLSQEFHLEIWRDGHTWEMDFSCGAPPASCAGGHQQAARHQGSLSPRQVIFTATEFNYDTLAQRLREMAFLNKGLEITLTDETHRRPQDRRSPPRGVQVRRRHR